MVVFLYCDSQDNTQTAVNLLGSLAKQLIIKRGEIPAYAGLLYRRHDHGATPLNAQECEDVINALGPFNGLFIVVDAIDELRPEVRTELFHWFDVWISRRTSTNPDSWAPRIFITSRHAVLDQEKISNLEIVNLDLSKNIEDFKSYAMLRVRNASFPLALKLQADPTLANRVVDTIVEKSQGM
jgi:hypothetical protein